MPDIRRQCQLSAPASECLGRTMAIFNMGNRHDQGHVATCPFAGERRRGSRVRFPKKERCAESPPTFICGKRRKNRRKPVKMKILSSGVVFTLEEAISTFHVCLKGQQPIFQNCGNCVTLTLFLFIFLRSTKVGLLLLRTLHQRGNQTYVVLSLKVNQAILLLER